MSRLSYNELKIGTIFIKDGDPFKVLEYAFVRMQQRKPVVQLKIENLLSGKVVDYSAHQNEEFEEAEIENTPVVFIYQNRGEYWFTEKGNPKNRFQLKVEIIGKAAQFLKPNLEVTAYKFSAEGGSPPKDGQAASGGGDIINVELPIKMDLKVTEAPPAVKGNTAQGGTKSVTLETGAKLNVPLFINEGDILRINTAVGEYVERVEKA